MTAEIQHLLVPDKFFQQPTRHGRQVDAVSDELENRIRVFRTEHRNSQAELAGGIGVSRKTISTIEVGRFIPSTLIALKIARYFGVSVEQVFSLSVGQAEC